MKLLQSQIDNYNRKALTEMNVDENESTNTEPLICNEFAISIQQKLNEVLDKWEPKMAPLLKKYLGLPGTKKINTCENNLKKILSAFVVYYDLPKNVFNGAKCDNCLSVLMKLESFNLDVSAVHLIERLIR